jgi:hypothetical protein
MQSERHRSAFTLKDLLALAAVIGLLLVILLPLLRNDRDVNSRQNGCANKVKQIGLGLMNYRDVFRCFPALTSQGNADGSANVGNTAPGATFAANSAAPNGYQQSPASAAGYSWIFMILPYVEETVLYNAASVASNKFEYEAFSTTGAGGAPFSVTLNGASRHFATIELDEVACPSYGGSAISTASSGTAQPPVVIPAYASLYSVSAGRPSGVAISNYVALSATHLACMALGPDDPATTAAEPPNGVIVPGPGVSLEEITDGSSKTFMLCETKEPAINSWYDGTVCWTVGANPSASRAPVRNGNGYWTVPPGTTGESSLNFGPVKNKSVLFAPNGTTPAQTQPVSWGPSSDHTGGVVLHLAADASVHVITQDIDPTLYLQLITRAGHEPVTLP